MREGHTPALFAAISPAQLAQSPVADEGNLLAQQVQLYPHALLRLSSTVGCGVGLSPSLRLADLSSQGRPNFPSSGGASGISTPWILLGQRRWRAINTACTTRAAWPLYIEARLTFGGYLKTLHGSAVAGVGLPAPSALVSVNELARGLAPRSASEQPRHGFTPMREDVGSMRRLRLTRGVCLPVSTPIHGVFGSKDVIHSWAIPGLGLKVDCIPGYNSHKRIFLSWRGAFWGQCMEVCGRYHHWMPILVRVTHRDTFLSWCISYVDGLRSADLNPVRAQRGTPLAASVAALAALS